MEIVWYLAIIAVICGGFVWLLRMLKNVRQANIENLERAVRTLEVISLYDSEKRRERRRISL